MLILAVMLASLVIVVGVLLFGLIHLWQRKRRAGEGDWRSRALDACADANALHDRIEMRLATVESDGSAGASTGRWSDTERAIDRLSAKLQALHFGAPDYTTDQTTHELLMALTALRAALLVEHAAPAASSVPAGEPVSTVQARLIELDTAIGQLRATI